MGVKFFFKWFKETFSHHITTIHTSTPVKLPQIDNLMLDLNGIFHRCAQKVFKYGSYKPLYLPLKPLSAGLYTKKQTDVFKEICFEIDKLVRIINPTTRVVLCIDGTAPVSKQNQQRQRRFLAVKQRDKEQVFDSCCISPGSVFMDYLSKYIDWYLRKQISEDENWKHLEVIFSNEKVPGEGEHTLLEYIRRYGKPDESFCINGVDADLIMLTLSTHHPKMFILRDDMYSDDKYHFIDVSSSEKEIAELLEWPTGKEYNEIYGVNDFVFICYLVGNDFLPHIPTVEILLDGIEMMIDIYKIVGEKFGHLTMKNERGEIRFVKESLCVFFKILGDYEQDSLQTKLLEKNEFFEDKLLEQYSVRNGDEYIVDITGYRKQYYSENFNTDNFSLEYLSQEYLEGLQWVLSYYTKGVPNWRWRFPFHYAPFASTLAQHIHTFKFPYYPVTQPIVPFVQLLCILPPESANLLPEPLNKLLKSEKFKKFCPDDFKVDISGKKFDWEGTVVLPMIDYTFVEDEYKRLLGEINERELRRNILGKVLRYTRDSSGIFTTFKSYYGDIESCVKISVFRL